MFGNRERCTRRLAADAVRTPRSLGDARMIEAFEPPACRPAALRHRGAPPRSSRASSLSP